MGNNTCIIWNINDVNYTNTFDNVIPPYKAVKLNQPLRSINLQGTNKEGLGLPDNNNFINPNNIWKDKTNSVIVFKGITNGLALWEYRKYLLTPLTEINEDLGNNNPTKDKQIIRWNNTLKKWEYVDHTVLNSPLSEINSSNLTKQTSEGYILMSKGGSTGLWKYFNLQEWITQMEQCCTDVTNRLEALEDAVEEANKTFNVIWKYIDKSYTESVKNNEYAKWGGSTSGINTVIAYVSTKDYEFDGEWNGFDYQNIAVTEEQILTAKLYKLYTVTWKSDETLLKTQKVRENTTVTYTEETPIKIGYTFNGWNPNPENTPITQNTTFIAKWIAKAVYIETNHPEISGKGDVEDPTTITYWAQVDNNIIADENVKLVVVSNDGLQFSEDLENSPKIVNGKWVKTITVAKNNEERLKSYTVKVIYDNIEKELTIKQQGKDWTPSFDYMVFKYDWDSDNSGADIDSATIINCNKIPITETTKLSDYYVGFPSTDNGKSRVILNGNKLNAVTKYLEWGGDTTKPGAEGACINFKQLCKDYAKTLVNQGIEEITVDIYARKYYSNISIKRLTISYDLYKGENGLNIDSNNTFIPNAGTTIVQNDLENSYTTQDIAGNISQGYINVKLLDTKIMSVIYNINTTSAKIVKHNPFETGATLLELLITGNITIYLDGEEIIRSIINTTKSDTGYSFDNYNPSPGTIYTLNKNISYNSEHNIIIEITNLTYTETITYYNGKTLYGDISHVFNINDQDVNRVYYYSESTGVSNESCPFNVNLEGNTLGNLKCTINTNVFIYTEVFQCSKETKARKERKNNWNRLFS